MKNKLYRKVYCKDRSPSQQGFYDTNRGLEGYWVNNIDPQWWLDNIIWWLEEVNIPTMEDIEQEFPINDDDDDDDFHNTFRQTGAKYVINKLLK